MHYWSAVLCNITGHIVSNDAGAYSLTITDLSLIEMTTGKVFSICMHPFNNLCLALFMAALSKKRTYSLNFEGIPI